MFIHSILQVYHAATTAKHKMEKIIQQHARNFQFYLGKTTGIHNFRLSLPSLPNAQGHWVFCRNRKVMGSCYAEVF